MKPSPVILIFDVGKTNKKILLFDEHYHLVWEQCTQVAQITDQDGFACDDLEAITQWVKNSFRKILTDKRFVIRAVNFCAYGASFVYLGEELKPILPLINYLKPYPPQLQDQFYEKYGGKTLFSKSTASPVLGSLNSGMQLYRLKEENPERFIRIKHALHLPQYLSFLITGGLYSELTSIGCHTQLWDFSKRNYHSWVAQEGLLDKFPPIVKSDAVTTKELSNAQIVVGPGLHDSTAALIPYLTIYDEPFVLISTGTWSISLNPFNREPLTSEELSNDCLCYLDPTGNPIKASRLFAGHEYDTHLQALCNHFNISHNYFTSLSYNPVIVGKLEAMIQSKQFRLDDDSHGKFIDPEEAYYALMLRIITKQVRSTNLVIGASGVTKIFVDGGFSRNVIYMQMLATKFSKFDVSAASVPQGSALGAALIMHRHWNRHPIQKKIDLIPYHSLQQSVFVNTIMQ